METLRDSRYCVAHRHGHKLLTLDDSHENISDHGFSFHRLTYDTSAIRNRISSTPKRMNNKPFEISKYTMHTMWLEMVNGNGLFRWIDHTNYKTLAFQS